MIEIIDKINNICKRVKREDNMMVIHPLNKEAIFLDEMELIGKEITGVIFKEDGTTLILHSKKKVSLIKKLNYHYKKLIKKIEKK